MTRPGGSRVGGQWAMLAMLAIGAVGCRVASVAGESDETEIEEVEYDADSDDVDQLDEPAQQPDSRRAALSRSPSSVTIKDIQRPASLVVPGARVAIDGPAIKVTAVGAGRFWVQEAGASGLCDDNPAAVEHRGIAVMPPSASDLDLSIGQRVIVTGTVAELGGNTTLVDAEVIAIGAPSTPYKALCDRGGLAMTSEALEGVLVLTAGHTWGSAPSVDGVWGLDTCFDDGSVEFGSLLYFPDAWSESWHWVRGVVVQADEQRLVMPRNAEDVMSDLGDDVCL